MDLRSFVKSLRVYPYDAIREALVKYALSSMLKLIVRWQNIPKWFDLFKSLLNEDLFILIVLDSCRYDFFNSLVKKHLHGRLLAVSSPGPDTYSWFKQAFSYPKFRNIQVFYPRLAIETHDVKLGKFIPGDRNVDVIEIRPKRMKEIGTVSPEEVNEEVFEKGLDKRNIIWYMQPHFPWIFHKKLSLELMNEVKWQDFTPKDLIREKIKSKGISRREIVKAYVENLKAVLEAVSILISWVMETGFKGKIIITSDHGELLGEYGLYLHPHYELPQLYIVPWFEVEDVV